MTTLRSDFGPGDRVDDYEIVAPLSVGGFGAVYRARDTVRGRTVALKVLHAELAGLGEPLVRFLREVRVLEELRHPSVVEIFGAGLFGAGRAYYAMELLEGMSLQALLDERGRLAPVKALRILASVCAALDAAHARGVVHRDLKASNVFLEDAGARRVVLLDFGVARVRDGGVRLTRSNQSIGTPSSMAPEQASGADVDARADVYGLGVLAYHMLTGRLPFAECAPALMADMHATAARPRPSTHARVSQAVDEVIMRAMARYPESRHSSARAFLDALEQAFDEAPAAGRPAAQPRRSVGLLVETLPKESALDDGDEALLADMEGVLGAAARHLTARGFTTALETGNSLLFVRAIEDDDVGARVAALDAAVELERVLDDRPGRDDRIEVLVCLHAAAELLDLAWAPAPSASGLVGTTAFFEELQVATTPLATGFARVVGFARGSNACTTVAGGTTHVQRMAEIGRLTASIMHELRSPLAALNLNLAMVLDTLRSGTPPGAAEVSALEDAVAGAGRIAHMASEVLGMSTPGGDSSHEPVALAEVVDSAITLTRGELRTKAEVHIARGNDARVSGSRTRLIQLLVNLLVNAGQAIDGWGRIEVSVTRSGDRVVLQVEDSGRGMDEAVQRRLGEPFFSTRVGSGGTGLGLSIVREIVTEHRGTLSVRSAPGRGTCMIVELPALSPDRN